MDHEDKLYVINATSGAISPYSSIEDFLENADNELYKGNIALPCVYDKYLREEGDKAIAEYAKMVNDCRAIAENKGKRGLIVSFMAWTSDCAYMVRAFDAINGHQYQLERFKSYSNEFEVCDDETGRYLDCNKFYPHIDWDFCRNHFIPLQRELYELRTPVDGRCPSPLPFEATILRDRINVDSYPRLFEAIDMVNQFRNDEHMDLLVNRTWMFKLESRLLRLVKLISLQSPLVIIEDEIRLILQAYDNVLIPFITRCDLQ